MRTPSFDMAEILRRAQANVNTDKEADSILKRYGAWLPTDSMPPELALKLAKWGGETWRNKLREILSKHKGKYHLIDGYFVLQSKDGSWIFTKEELPKEELGYYDPKDLVEPITGDKHMNSLYKQQK